MYFFDKKTMYLVWNMREGQARGIGTVKFLAMDAVCRIEVVITGCGKVQGTYPVYVLSGDVKSLLGEIAIGKGKGNLYLKCKTGALGHQAVPYKHVTGLHIDLKTEGYLEQRWLPMQEDARERASTPSVKNRADAGATESEAKQKEEKESGVRTRADAWAAESEGEQKEEKESGVRTRADAWATESEGEQKEEKESGVKAQGRAWIVESKKVQEEVKENTIKKSADVVKPPEKSTMALYPNKWQQLCAIYPVVHPFQDGRAYLSIEPRDFVILQERYQPMTQNSFLLHGFYHYRHLLLGKQQQGKNVQYYLGVPGVFYEKEKAAALYYGFESFEGAVTPAAEGSFGYYMKRVQI